MQFSKGKPLILDVKSQKKIPCGGLFPPIWGENLSISPPGVRERGGGEFPPLPLSDGGGFLAKSCFPPIWGGNQHPCPMCGGEAPQGKILRIGAQISSIFLLPPPLWGGGE